MTSFELKLSRENACTMSRRVSALFLLILASALAATLQPAAAADRSGYYEWSTKRPFSGWIGIPPRTYYCDYIKYPIRKCATYRVCHHGKCTDRPRCKVVGWDIRQSCS